MLTIQYNSTFFVFFAACIVAIFFGLLCLLPNIAQRFDPHADFQGIEMMGTDQEFYYGARAIEIEDGYWSAANVYVASPKNQPYLQPALPEWTIVMVGKLFGLTALSSFILSKFFLGFSFFIAFFGFAYSVTHRAWISLASVTIVIFMNAWLNAPWDFFSFLESGIISLDFLRFSRPINPQWSSLFFFLGLWLLSSWMQRPSCQKIVALGLCLSVLLYSYVYAWTYLGVAIGLLCVYLFAIHKRRQSLSLLLVFAIFLFLGLPYLSNVWDLIHHPWYASTAMRQGLFHGRDLVFGSYLIVFMVTTPLSRRYFPATWPLFPCLALAGFIAFNQQIITGTMLVYHHYQWYFLQPLAAFFFLSLIFILAQHITKRYAFIQKYGVILVIIIAMITGTVQQVQAYQFHNEEWRTYQSFSTIFQFLNKAGSVDDVVFASRKSGILRDLIPIYTSLNVYTAGNANNFLTSSLRARETLFFDLWLEGLEPEDAEKRFSTDLRVVISERLYGIFYREITGNYAAIPDQELIDLASEYQIYSSLPLSEKIQKYPIDILVQTSEDVTTVAWSQFLSCTTEVFAAEGYTVRLMIPQGDVGTCL